MCATLGAGGDDLRGSDLCESFPPQVCSEGVNDVSLKLEDEVSLRISQGKNKDAFFLNVEAWNLADNLRAALNRDAGNQLEVDKVRFDFSLEDFDREVFKGFINKANGLFKQEISVCWYELPREKAMKIPGVVKMAKAFPPNIPTLRIVEIEGFDKQADGGTHVQNLKEVGAIEMIKAENKGKNNRRIYFRLAS